MRVGHRKVLAQYLNIVNRLRRIVVNVLLDRQDRLVLVRVLQLLRQFGHLQVRVLVLEGEELEFEVNFTLASGVLGIGVLGVGSGGGFGLLGFQLVLPVDRGLRHFTFGDTFFVHFVQEFGF